MPFKNGFTPPGFPQAEHKRRARAEGWHLLAGRGRGVAVALEDRGALQHAEHLLAKQLQRGSLRIGCSCRPSHLQHVEDLGLAEGRGRPRRPAAAAAVSSGLRAAAAGRSARKGGVSATKAVETQGKGSVAPGGAAVAGLGRRGVGVAQDVVLEVKRSFDVALAAHPVVVCAEDTTQCMLGLAGGRVVVRDGGGGGRTVGGSEDRSPVTAAR